MQYRLPEHDDVAVIAAALTQAKWNVTAAISKEILSAAFCDSNLMIMIIM